MNDSARALASIDRLLTETQRILIDYGIAPELAAAVAALARKGAIAHAAERTNAPRPTGVTARERLLSVQEFARECGVHERTIVRHIESGRLESIKIGRQHRIPQHAADAYLSRTVAPHESDPDLPHAA